MNLQDRLHTFHPHCMTSFSQAYRMVYYECKQDRPDPIDSNYDPHCPQPSPWKKDLFSKIHNSMCSILYTPIMLSFRCEILWLQWLPCHSHLSSPVSDRNWLTILSRSVHIPKEFFSSISLLRYRRPKDYLIYLSPPGTGRWVTRPGLNLNPWFVI